MSSFVDSSNPKPGMFSLLNNTKDYPSKWFNPAKANWLLVWQCYSESTA